MNKYTEANKRLALALGWTEIVEVGGALLGTPPDGAPKSRGQAMVPDWCGDWKECGPLMGHVNFSPLEYSVRAQSMRFPSFCSFSFFAAHESKDSAMRFSVTDVYAKELEYAK
jgi:hypothetical protein